MNGSFRIVEIITGGALRVPRRKKAVVRGIRNGRGRQSGNFSRVVFGLVIKMLDDERRRALLARYGIRITYGRVRSDNLSRIRAVSVETVLQRSGDFRFVRNDPFLFFHDGGEYEGLVEPVAEILMFRVDLVFEIRQCFRKHGRRVRTRPYPVSIRIQESFETLFSFQEGKIRREDGKEFRGRRFDFPFDYHPLPHQVRVDIVHRPTGKEGNGNVFRIGIRKNFFEYFVEGVFGIFRNPVRSYLNGDFRREIPNVELRSPTRFQFQLLRHGRCGLPFRNGKRNRLYDRFAVRCDVVSQNEEDDCRKDGENEEETENPGSFPGRLRNRYARPTVSFHKLPGFTNRSGRGRSRRRGTRSGGTGQ